MSDTFIWRAGDLVVYPLCTVSVVIDGEPRSWYNAAWSPDSGLDVALIFDSALSGAPTFNPSDRGPMPEPSVEEIMLRDVAQTGTPVAQATIEAIDAHRKPSAARACAVAAAKRLNREDKP